MSNMHYLCQTDCLYSPGCLEGVNSQNLISKMVCRVRSTHSSETYKRIGSKNRFKAPSKTFKAAERVSAPWCLWGFIDVLNGFLGGRFGGPGDEIYICMKRSVPGFARAWPLI